MNRIALAALIVCLASGLRADDAAKPGEWRSYGGDAASSRYSPLDQINAANAKDLEIAWRWESPDGAISEAKRIRPDQFKVTPLMIGGVLYASTGFSQLAAIDAGTGKNLWVHDPKSYEKGRPTNSGYQHRGVSYWSDGKEERIIYATGGKQLVAVDAKTGQPCAGFGENGQVDLTQGYDRPINARYITMNSPPAICRDTIVVGSVIFDFPPGVEMPPGDVRGYDVRTGNQKWIFHVIPQEGEPGAETWEEGSWKYSGGANVWTSMSADEELGYVYLPTSTPTNDFYGGHRLGDNLYAESIVCLEAATGKRVWSFQAVRHGLWDYDFPCAPNLVDITVEGKKVKALAQVSKQAFCYVLDRATGKPVWPIEDRPVGASDVPGERAAAAQPFPTKPPAFDRQGITEDDLIDFTPELRAEAKKIASEYQLGPLYTPPSMITAERKGTLILPSAAGGANWGGAAFDPESGVLFVPSMTIAMILGISEPPDPARTTFKYLRTGPWLVEGPQGLPLLKPPYGRITAIDLNKGEILWQVPHGDGPRDHPAIKHLNLPPLGAAANGVLSNGGGIATKSLYFVMQATEDPSKSNMMRMGKDGYLRAFDKKTGELAAELKVPLTPHGTPMTYLHGGKQYVVLAAGGSGQPSELIAYALP